MLVSARHLGVAILHSSKERFVEWVVVSVAFGLIAFTAGWAYGKTKKFGVTVYDKARPHVEEYTGTTMPAVTENTLGKWLAWTLVPAIVINAFFFGSLAGC